MKKFLAVLLSCIMVMAMGLTGMAANSVEFTTGETTMTFTTELLMSDTAITAPDVTFEYTITEGAILYDETTNTTVSEGIDVDDIEIGTAVFTTDDALAPNATDRTFTYDVEVDFSEVTWTTPGIYHYIITATTSSVDGIVMDNDSTRDVYVYVVYDTSEDADDNALIISNIIMTDEAATTTAVTLGDTNDDDDILNEVTKSEGFVNGYGIDPNEDPSDADVDDSAYEDFLVTVNVDGNMADRDKDFTVTLTTSEGGIDDGTIFTVTSDNSDDTGYIAWNDGQFVEATYDEENGGWTFGTESVTFTLSDGETYTIHSVVNGMQFTTTITDETNYTIYSNMNDAANSTTEQLELANTVVVSTEDDVEQSNESNNYVPTYDLIIPDTGVILELLPFVLIVLFAGALMVVRFTKATRRNK